MNPLDLSYQKSKASIGRSVARRPPTRPRIREESNTKSANRPFSQSSAETTAATNLHRVSRLCHQIHDSAVRQAFGVIGQRKDTEIIPNKTASSSSDGGVEICEIKSDDGKSSTTTTTTTTNARHTNLTRTKSTSSEDLLLTPERDKTKSSEDLEDLEQLQSWRRCSKIRRSLQFPKQGRGTPTRPPDLPEGSVSVKKIKEDLETGRRLSTALRGNNVDLEALDQILQSISGSSSTFSDKEGSVNEEPERDKQIIAKKQKRNSFVTVESIQEVKGRLRRTSSPSSDIYNKAEEDPDDGIGSEETPVSLKQLNSTKMESKVKSYVYGMENSFKKPVIGTGSLESRSKQYNNGYLNRNEDWYNRRKSYGFEQVQNEQEHSISTKFKGKIESSTDSGICRSSEIVIVPSTKTSESVNKSSEYSSCSENEDRYIFDKVNKAEKINGNTVLNIGSVKKFSSYFDKKDTGKSNDNFKNNWNRQSNKEIESTTITIPIGSKSPTFLKSRDFQKQTTDDIWNKPETDCDVKRHSIAVDDYKYVSKSSSDETRRKSLFGGEKLDIGDNQDDDASSVMGRSRKKVEFCKTEVHFAADSGRVNIVETDEKPPPTQNFRRKRRTSALIASQIEEMSKEGIPVMHFGDTSFEKSLFGVTEPEDLNAEKESVTCGNVTVNSDKFRCREVEEEQRDLKELTENEVRKGILKNKLIKPKPYLLGEMEPLENGNEIGGADKWGVKLKPVQKDEGTFWKSTVTVRNTFYERNSNSGSNNEGINENYKDNVTSGFKENGSYLESINAGYKNSINNSGYKDNEESIYKENIDNDTYKSTNSTHKENRNYKENVNSSCKDSINGSYKENSSRTYKENTIKTYQENLNREYGQNHNYCENYNKDGYNETNNEHRTNNQEEFQKLLKTLKPASPKKSDSFNESKRNSENFGGIRIFSSPVDNRRASWSVADRVKQVEDMQWSENKGYSTKINIGCGEATVVENGHNKINGHPTWPRCEEPVRGEFMLLIACT